MSDEFDDIPRTGSIRIEMPEMGPREPCLIVMSGHFVGHRLALPPNSTRVVGRAAENALALDDDGVSRRHAQLQRAGEGDVVLEDLGSTNGTFVNGERVSTRVLQEGDRVQFGAQSVARFAWLDPIERAFHQSQYDAARLDALTNCYNKRFLLEHLNTEFAFARRHQRSVTAVMVDIDHFKPVNDTHGHVAGDAVLQKVAALLKSCIRNDDILARYGGEEFTILARELHAPGARVMAERICSCLRAAPIRVGALRIPITVSLGIAHGPADAIAQPEDLLRAADERLYRAKAGGRDRFVDD